MNDMKQELTAALKTAVQELFHVESDPILTRPEAQYGDYSSNVAMQLAGKLGKPPREIATMLAERVRETHGSVLAEVSVAGAGFLNMHLTDTALLHMVAGAREASFAGKTIVIEYSDPNPFKPLHAGHLYTTLVGDTISRLLESAGARVVRVNYGGDVGRHVARSMWAILQKLGGEHPEKLTEIAEADRPTWLGERYVEGTHADEEEAGAKDEIVAINKRVYALHETDDHDSPFARIYWTCRQWSYDYFETLYTQLQVKPFDRYVPESTVTPLALKTIEQQLEAGVYQRMNGAVVFVGEPHGLHTRVFINSAGLPTYEAKDVGLSLMKWQDYHFDQSIIITANEQAQYMQVVIKSIEQFAPEPAKRTKHLTHGVVKLLGGVKMSSRRGNVVTALSILDAAREAGAATGTNPSEDTILAAVKYTFAKVRIGGDIVYDPKESIALEGNSGPYLQYAHARARSILRKAVSKSSAGISDLDAAETELVQKISGYADAVGQATDELMPHHICAYLYELSQLFNRFYEHNRVIGSDREEQRLQLVQLYADTLKQGLNLLGIHAPDTM